MSDIWGDKYGLSSHLQSSRHLDIVLEHIQISAQSMFPKYFETCDSIALGINDGTRRFEELEDKPVE